MPVLKFKERQTRAEKATHVKLQMKAAKKLKLLFDMRKPGGKDGEKRFTSEYLLKRVQDANVELTTIEKYYPDFYAYIVPEKEEKVEKPEEAAEEQPEEAPKEKPKKRGRPKKEE